MKNTSCKEEMKRRFRGGIHPNDRKELSEKAKLTAIEGPAYVAIPMSQHIGAPCTPLVEPGEYVKKGQKIGDGEGLCVPVHASVSGRVIAVEPRPHPSGKDVLAVVIENDFKDCKDSAMAVSEDYSKLSSKEIHAIIREAGIVGMGGAAFSTNIKISSGVGKVDTLIANACECEPYITADDILLRSNPEHVLEGIKIVCQVLQPKRVILAIEDNKKAAIHVLKDLLNHEEAAGDAGNRRNADTVNDQETEQERKAYPELRILQTRYPQGAEKQLIQTVTGREIGPGQLPASVGCVVLNVTTLASIYRAVCEGEPVTERIVTVTGEGVKNPGNFMVPIGASFADVTKAAGGLKDNVWKVISGGPMMGMAQADLSASVIKGTNAVLCLTHKQNKKADEAAERACIRCGKCLSVCPMRLQPLYLYCYEKAENLEELSRMHVMDCMECGCCAYVCPGKLPLVERFRNAKRLVKEGMSK